MTVLMSESTDDLQQKIFSVTQIKPESGFKDEYEEK